MPIQPSECFAILLLLVLFSFTVIARSASDEAIHTSFAAVDCFAEFIIGRRFAPTRWLAMTVSIAQYRLAIGSSSAGNSVITWQPRSVTTTSSSMRAAENPSLAGQ